MANNKVEKVEVTEVEVVETESINNVIRLARPITFEGKRYEEIDMNPLENMKASDMIATGKLMNRQGDFSIMPEMDMNYALNITARVLDIPIELLNELSPKDAIAVKNRVAHFFYGQD